jgi:potassium-transporting ATPase potassium-binding subunit
VNIHDWILIAVYFGALAALTPPLAAFLARVFGEDRRPLRGPLAILERAVFRVTGIDPAAEMTARTYMLNLLAFHAVGLAALIALQAFQARLPLNPAGLPDVPLPLAFNTAVSFVTNTNWQAYSGESTLGPLVQSFGLGVQNFLSAASGIAVLLAFIRGVVRQGRETVGNYWADLVRSVVHVLLPLSVLWAVLLTGEGVVQSWSAGPVVRTPAGTEQAVPLGPVASQVAIKQLGTNGGGYYGVNSAHPFENPTPFSDFLEMLAILLIPSALVLAYGRLTGQRRQGRMIWAVMLFLLAAGLAAALAAEFHSRGPAWPGLEGKEQRFGTADSVLWAVTTTAASNGSVNAMHASLSPAAGGAALLNILLGEVVFGGVGVGLTGMLMFVLIAVFIAGLMVGRTPEYLGKKIEAFEIQMAMVVLLVPNLLILLGTGLAVSVPAGLAARSAAGPHGFTEILYAFASASGNNGSAFAGLAAGTPFYCWTLAAAMLLGRLAALLPILAIAGGLAAKRPSPATAGTLRTDTGLFACVLAGVIVIVGALTFFPALCLGPIVEQGLFGLGRLF